MVHRSSRALYTIFIEHLCARLGVHAADVGYHCLYVVVNAGCCWHLFPGSWLPGRRGRRELREEEAYEVHTARYALFHDPASEASRTRPCLAINRGGRGIFTATL